MAGVWTNNWRAFRNIMLMASHHNGLSTFKKTDGSTAADKYNEEMMATSPLGTYSNDENSSNSENTIKIGTGNTAPAATDYNLASRANVSYLTISFSNPTYNDQTGVLTRTITLSVQNQSGGSITIREWGIFGHVRTSEYYSSAYAEALLYREVLDSPVVLANYQTATIQVTVSLTLSDPVA